MNPNLGVESQDPVFKVSLPTPGHRQDEGADDLALWPPRARPLSALGDPCLTSTRHPSAGLPSVFCQGFIFNVNYAKRRLYLRSQLESWRWWLRGRLTGRLAEGRENTAVGVWLCTCQPQNLKAAWDLFLREAKSKYQPSKEAVVPAASS